MGGGNSLYIYAHEPRAVIISCVATRFVTQAVLLISPTQCNTIMLVMSCETVQSSSGVLLVHT